MIETYKDHIAAASSITYSAPLVKNSLAQAIGLQGGKRRNLKELFSSN